jgi:hypothetical protein
MKKFMIALTMLLIFASPAWAVTLEELGSGQSAINAKLQAIADNDDANKAMLSSEIEAAKVQEATNAAATLNAIGAIPVTPATDLNPVISAVQTAESNMIANDNLNTQAVLDAVAALATPAVPELCPGATSRFLVSGDGTEVCDSTTGLHWERSVTLGQADAMDYATALLYCENRGATLGNGKTYRMPSINEYVALMDYSVYEPRLTPGHPFTLSTDILDGVRSFYSTSDWPISPIVGQPVQTVIEISHGNVFNVVEIAQELVWCVR